MKIRQSKYLINLGIVFSLVGSFYILFLQSPIGNDKISVQILFYLGLLVYQTRYFYLINLVKKNRVTFQLIEKQKNPILIDTIVGLFLFCALPVTLSFVNKKFNSHLDWKDITAIGLYLLGTMITLISESQRRKWKNQNINRLYQGGLFKYANHINYFGETLSFPTLCWLATGSTIILIIALTHQIIDFTFIQIPRQEEYLKKKYPMDFKKTANRKKLIPLIY